MRTPQKTMPQTLTLLFLVLNCRSFNGLRNDFAVVLNKIQVDVKLMFFRRHNREKGHKLQQLSRSYTGNVVRFQAPLLLSYQALVYRSLICQLSRPPAAPQAPLFIMEKLHASRILNITAKRLYT